MTTKTQIGFGLKIRKKVRAVEAKQRKKQTCPFCKKEGAKRLSKGIWLCKKCGKKFASGTFYIE
jgi:large subunit ribosomal protein L37Ae